MALQLESNTASDVCLVYISDGGAYDAGMARPLPEKIRVNSSSMNLIVIGVEVANNEAFVEKCRNLALATHNRSSKYIETNEENVTQAFRQASSLVNTRASFSNNRLQHALTMQRF